MNRLTGKQRMFVAEYLVDLNATQAAIRAGYEAKQRATTDKEKIAADERIRALEARRDVLVAEGSSRINAIMRAGYGIPPMIYLGKLYVWDKVLGWGVTDPLSPELWNVLWTVVGF